MNLIKAISKIAIKAVLVIVGVLGIVLTAQSTEFMGGGSVFFFFTVQSNIFIMLIALLFLINEVELLISKKNYINQVFLHIKYVATIAITITFIVFFTMLAPLMGMDYPLRISHYMRLCLS